MTKSDLRTADPWEWRSVDPTAARSLSSARGQLHHCAQFVSGFGISYLPRASDDSHTSMRWDAVRRALVSQRFQDVAVALRVHDLTLLVLRDGHADVELPAHGISIAALEGRLRSALAGAELDAARYTLTRLFEIPAHPVAAGSAFDASDPLPFGALATWYANASLVLEEIRAERRGSPVSCWPHHFDIATLITVAPGRTTGAGLSPGDGYYDEPYFYANAYPQPAASALTDAVGGAGRWHTFEWIGAVLPGSDLTYGDANQLTETRAFFQGALDRLRQLS
jgi:hypothetical protein